jgi:hypothetical protein
MRRGLKRTANFFIGKSESRHPAAFNARDRMFLERIAQIVGAYIERRPIA